MIEPNDTLFPLLDAALASYPGVETEGAFRGWMKNSIAKSDDIGGRIHEMLRDEAAWQLVYRLVSMKTKKLCLQDKGGQIEVTHAVEGGYSYGSGPAVVTVSMDAPMRELLVIVGVLVQIVQFIETNGRKVERKADDDDSRIDADPDHSSDPDTGGNSDDVPRTDPAKQNALDVELQKTEPETDPQVENADEQPAAEPDGETVKPKKATARKKKVKTDEPD